MYNFGLYGILNQWLHVNKLFTQRRTMFTLLRNPECQNWIQCELAQLDTELICFHVNMVTLCVILMKRKIGSLFYDQVFTNNTVNIFTHI